ncbi:MAG: SH3 domain-containing protein [Chlamydia sp.]
MIKRWALSLLFLQISIQSLFGYEEHPLFTKTQKGYSAYISALSEPDSKKREEKMNEAIGAYLEVSKEKPVGAVLANIGTLQLYAGDSGLALFYLKKASLLDPRNQEIQEMLLSTQKILHIEQKNIPPSFIDLISCSKWLSPSEKYGIMIGIGALALCLFSLMVWIPAYGVRLATNISATLFVLSLLLFSIAPYFLSNPKAIVQHTVTLKGSYDEKVAASPGALTLLPGEEVEILAMNREKEWLRVRTYKKITGYVPGALIRIYE